MKDRRRWAAAHTVRPISRIHRFEFPKLRGLFQSTYLLHTHVLDPGMPSMDCPQNDSTFCDF